ncbi:putative lipoprotein [Myxococcus hansupus]|uniref:Putative lipoprotein n=1 Tax=Pseudomyxococcus hansupus TaxID=1297742 RepID=A0A0H4XPE6_9BACT|nr:PQQ-binding-like beta-propeller repeat protein [Myxococcus hansupus]AKQ70247.1 putative lipoprotein [Myxococcus hansupus]
MSRKPLLALLLGASVLSAACSDDPKPDPAVLIIDRDAVDFGELELGQSSPEVLFTVRNASPWAVESVSVKVEGSGFTIAASTCERFLDAGRECEVRVRFSPLLAGPSEAHLRVEGAPEVDSAVLKGMAVGHVEVRSLPGGGVRVVAEGEDWSCDGPCRVPVRKPRLTLRTEPAGFPEWGGDCTVVAGGGCSLVMDGTKVVSLRELAPFVLWEVRRDAHPRSMAVTPGGDIVVLEYGHLLRFSGTGALRWSVSLSGGVKMAMDGEGNAYVVDASGWVTRYDVNGQVAWTFSPQTVGHFREHLLAVNASGHVYVLLNQTLGESRHQLLLIAISPQGAERWSQRIDEGDSNLAAGLAVDAQGEVYLSFQVFRQGETPQTMVFMKDVFRKYSAEGSLGWETQEGWNLFAVNAEGATSTFRPEFQGTTVGYSHRWIGANGATQWTETRPSGPGVLTLQTFAPTGTLLVGGHEFFAGEAAAGRGLFFAMNLATRAAGPVTYVEGDLGMGSMSRINGLALTPAGHVVVVGGLSAIWGQGEGYIRLYDRRVLTGVP